MDHAPLHASWRSRWQEGRTGWDQGGAHTALLDLVNAAQKYGHPLKDSFVLEPACGRAHNGATLASLGAHVVSFDVAPEAIAAARQMYPYHPRLDLVVHDAFVINPDWRDRFHFIFDRAALCALTRDVRRDYIKAAHAHLATGGFFLSIAFTAVHGDPEQGPPFPIPLRDMLPLMEEKFSLVYAQVLPELSPTLGRVAQETILIWRKV